MSNQKKINAEVNKIGILKLRIERILNHSQKEILDIKNEFEGKVNKVYTLIELSRQKIWKLKKDELKDKEVPGDLEYDLGIDWIQGETTKEVPIKFVDIDEAKEYVDEDLMRLETLE